MKRVAVIIPAYNEECSISSVVSDVIAINSSGDYKISTLVINDCSTDRTMQIVSECDCVLINLPVNLGIGGAVQTGFKYAMQHDFDYAVQCDGDGQHPAEEIPKLIKAISEDSYDIIIGSRFINKNSFVSSFMRRRGIHFFGFMIKILCKISITDSTSGFRIYNRKAFTVAANNYPDQYPEPESLIMFSKKKFRIAEVPVIMRERQGGVSSIQFFSSIYYMLKVSIAIFFTNMRKN